MTEIKGVGEGEGFLVVGAGLGPTNLDPRYNSYAIIYNCKINLIIHIYNIRRLALFNYM